MDYLDSASLDEYVKEVSAEIRRKEEHKKEVQAKFNKAIMELMAFLYEYFPELTITHEIVDCELWINFPSPSRPNVNKRLVVMGYTYYQTNLDLTHYKDLKPAMNRIATEIIDLMMKGQA